MLNAWIRKIKNKRFLNRNVKSFEEIYENYFSAKKYDREVCAEQWRKMGEILKLNEQLLLPTDRFDKELAPVWGFGVDDEMEDLSEWIYDELDARNSMMQVSQLLTLGEVVDALNGSE